MNSTTTFILGCAVGALAMYMLDPESGRRRRALVRDKATRYSQEAEEFVTSKAKHLRNKAKGAVAELTNA